MDKATLKKSAGLLLGLAVSAAILLWLASQFDVSEVWTVLLQTPMIPLVITVLLGYLAFPLRVVQWQILLGERDEVKAWPVFQAICIGHVGNLIFPMRGGELARCAWLNKRTGVPITRALTSVFLTRLQDIPPILALVAGVLWVTGEQQTALNDVADTLGLPMTFEASHLFVAFRSIALGAGVMAAVVVAVYFLRDRVKAWLEALAGYLPGIGQAAVNRLALPAIEGFEVVGSPPRIWMSQALSVLCWVIFAIAPIPLLMGFSLTFGQAAVTALAKTAFTTMAHFLPSAPGAIGTFHLFCVAALLLCNPEMPPETALAYAVASHLVSVLSPAVPGLILLPSLGWRPGGATS